MSGRSVVGPDDSASERRCPVQGEPGYVPYPRPVPECAWKAIMAPATGCIESYECVLSKFVIFTNSLR